MGLFGPDKLTMELEKTDYAPGEIIKGVLNINLKKPKKARRLEVGFRGERKERYESYNSDGSSDVGFKTIIVYRKNITLENEGEYQKGDYPFEIKIPEDILEYTMGLRPMGRFGNIASAFNFSGGGKFVKWFIKSNLDIPMGLDISKQRRILIA